MSMNSAIETLVESGWTFDEGVPGVRKGFRFENFERAFAFMTDVAAVAEDLNHHPDWRNVYSLVEILLTTHDKGGVSELDVTLGASVDLLAQEYGAVSID